MPSHIFFALGMWDRGAASNVDSYEAERDQARAENQALGGGGYHALHWLAYARAQQGRYDDAREVTERGIQHARDSDGYAAGYERYILSAFPASYVVETGRWDEMDDFAIDTTGLSPRLTVTARTVQGMAALKTGDRDAAESYLADARKAAEGERERLQIPIQQLDALLKLNAGDTDAALDALQAAADGEDELPLSFGPAWPLKPAHELYGEVLLDLDRPDEALAQFSKALERYPARALSLLGTARAAQQTGDTETAREAAAHLQQIWDDADPAVKEQLTPLLSSK
jgi:tetratricopeptide (TPR) repeat protein